MGHNHDHAHGPSVEDGVYGIDYYEGRHKKLQLVYRLRRRTDEVERALRSYTNGSLKTIVDLGTADGLMLRNLRDRVGTVRFLGIDYSLDLLKAQNLPGIWKTRGDVQKVPVLSGTADAVIACAVIEHVPDPDLMMRECARILRPGGLVIITTPAPFMEKISSAIGLLKEAGHHMTLNLKQLKQMAEKAGFEVMEASKFMFSPIGFPAEKTIEKIFGPLGLRLVMANQLLVARRGSVA